MLQVHGFIRSEAVFALGLFGSAADVIGEGVLSRPRTVCFVCAQMAYGAAVESVLRRSMHLCASQGDSSSLSARQDSESFASEGGVCLPRELSALGEYLLISASFSYHTILCVPPLHSPPSRSRLTTVCCPKIDPSAYSRNLLCPTRK